jgi:hypothetical protein
LLSGFEPHGGSVRYHFGHVASDLR